MNHLTPDLLTLANSLSVYDQGDLLASIGALQLVPENGDRTVRLELLAHVAASARQDSPNQISTGRLKKLCNANPVGSSAVIQLEDSAVRFLAEGMFHFGGTHRVFPGLVNDSPYVCQRLIEVFASAGKGLLSSELKARCNSLLFSTVQFSEHVAKKASIERGTRTVAYPGGNTVIPNTQELELLKAAVSFSSNDLTALLTARDITQDFVNLLSVRGGSIDLTDVDPWKGQLFSRPLVLTDDRLVLAIPGTLLSAARNAVITLAIEYGEVQQLSTEYCACVWNNIQRSLYFIGHSELGRIRNASDLTTPIIDGIFTLDVDKRLYVSLLTDDLSQYDSSDVFGGWHTDLPEVIRKKRANEIITDLIESNQGLSSILVLFITQSAGRAFHTIKEKPSVSNKTILIHFSADDLEVVSLVEYRDPLILWKFGLAERRLKETKLFPTDTLNEFAYYRSQKRTFYSDSDGVQILKIIGDDTGNELRVEAFRKSDRHAVLSADRTDWVEVISNARDIRVPIYVEPQSKFERVAFLLESLPIPIWVISPTLTDASQMDLIHIYLQFAECVAYWLWQFSPELSPFLEPLCNIFPNIIIQIVLPEHEQWDTMQRSDMGSPMRDESIEVVSSPASGALSATIHADALVSCASPTNDADRFLMRRVMRGLRNILSDPTAMADKLIDDIVDRHAPLGTKKMLIVLNAENVFGVANKGLPQFRKPDDADIEDILDDLGDHLTIDCKLASGEIASIARTDFLNKNVVGWLYQELVRNIALLHPQGLLDELVRRHETILQRLEAAKITIPTRLACYGFDETLRTEISDELHDFDMAAVTTRFLIEYVTAMPPTGVNRFSMSDYDRLVAFVWHILQFGFLSDIIQYNIADVGISILKSGRLGLDRSVYDQVATPFISIMGNERMEDAKRHYKRHWRSERPGDDTFPAHDANKAMLAECGYSLEDILLFFRFLLRDIAFDSSAIRRKKVKALLDEAGGALGWDYLRVANLLDLISLRPRPDFLKPVPPYRGFDVWPWRFNRRLSYLRRPILIVGVGAELEALWGIRHINVAVRYLLDILFGGRLPAFGERQSSEMSTFQGKLNQDRGPYFERRVEQLILGSQLPVARSVKRLGSVKVGEIGEIDILAANKRRRYIYVIECKDIALAKTPYEMGQQIGTLYNPDLTQKSAVSQALKKAEWVKQNFNACLHRLSISESQTSWIVQPMVVVDQRMLTPHFTGSPIPIVAVQDLVGMLLG